MAAISQTLQPEAKQTRDKNLLRTKLKEASSRGKDKKTLKRPLEKTDATVARSNLSWPK